MSNPSEDDIYWSIADLILLLFYQIICALGPNMLLPIILGLNLHKVFKKMPHQMATDMPGEDSGALIEDLSTKEIEYFLNRSLVPTQFLVEKNADNASLIISLKNPQPILVIDRKKKSSFKITAEYLLKRINTEVERALIWDAELGKHSAINNDEYLSRILDEIVNKIFAYRDISFDLDLFKKKLKAHKNQRESSYEVHRESIRRDHINKIIANYGIRPKGLHINILERIHAYVNDDSYLYQQYIRHELLKLINSCWQRDFSNRSELEEVLFRKITNFIKEQPEIKTFCELTSLSEIIRFKIQLTLKNNEVAKINQQFYLAEEQITHIKRTFVPQIATGKVNNTEIVIDCTTFIRKNYEKYPTPAFSNNNGLAPSQLTQAKIAYEAEIKKANEQVEPLQFLSHNAKKSKISSQSTGQHKKQNYFTLRTIKKTFFHDSQLNAQIPEEKVIIDEFNTCSEKRKLLITCKKELLALSSKKEQILTDLIKILQNDSNLLEKEVTTQNQYHALVKFYQEKRNQLVIYSQTLQEINGDLDKVKWRSEAEQSLYRQKLENLAQKAQSWATQQSNDKGLNPTHCSSENKLLISQKTTEAKYETLKQSQDTHTLSQTEPSAPSINMDNEAPPCITNTNFFSLVNTTRGWPFHEIEDTLRQIDFNLTQLTIVLNHLLNFKHHLNSSDTLVTYLKNCLPHEDSPAITKTYFKILWRDAVKNYLFRIHALLSTKMSESSHHFLYLFGPELGKQSAKIRNQFRHFAHQLNSTRILKYAQNILNLYQAKNLVSLLKAELQQKDSREKILSLKTQNTTEIAKQLRVIYKKYEQPLLGQQISQINSQKCTTKHKPKSSLKTNSFSFSPLEEDIIQPLALTTENCNEEIQKAILTINHLFSVTQKIYDEFLDTTQQDKSLAVTFGFDNLHQLFAMLEWQVIWLNHLLKATWGKNFSKSLRLFSNHIAHRKEISSISQDKNTQTYQKDLSANEASLLKDCIDKFNEVMQSIPSSRQNTIF